MKVMNQSGLPAGSPETLKVCVFPGRMSRAGSVTTIVPKRSPNQSVNDARNASRTPPSPVISHSLLEESGAEVKAAQGEPLMLRTNRCAPFPEAIPASQANEHSLPGASTGADSHAIGGVAPSARTMSARVTAGRAEWYVIVSPASDRLYAFRTTGATARGVPPAAGGKKAREGV